MFKTFQTSNSRICWPLYVLKSWHHTFLLAYEGQKSKSLYQKLRSQLLAHYTNVHSLSMDGIFMLRHKPYSSVQFLYTWKLQRNKKNCYESPFHLSLLPLFFAIETCTIQPMIHTRQTSYGMCFGTTWHMVFLFAT